ncbi:MAG: signal peptide peptidase SppA [Planctomycetes bacterium]|nr:signal peptide peptidase SppA [Planctomycetota bacterium]
MSDSFPFSPPPVPPPKPEPPPRPVFNPPTQPIEPQRSGRGCSFWFGWLLALVFLGTTALLLLTLLGIRSVEVVEQRTFIEKTISGRGENKILVVPVTGIISNRPREQNAFRTLPGMVSTIHNQLAQARKDPKIKAMILRVDSPGGGLTASDVIHNDIKRYKAATKNKVVVCMGDLAASGGYYVSAPADRIIAHPTTLTGSIGVIWFHANIEGLLEKLGISAFPTKSGPLKDMGSMTRQITPEEEVLFQNLIDQMYDRFVQVVSSGRTAAGVPLTPQAVRKIADGRIYSAPDAKDLRLVDQIGYMEDAIEAAKKLAKLKEAKVVQYFYPAITIFDILSAKAGGKPSISIDLDNLIAPDPLKLMYLWTGGAGRTR